MDLTQRVAHTLRIPLPQVAAAVDLLDSGNTLPFVARYRKEATGGLDEEQLRQITEQIASLRALEERRQTVLAAIEGQGKLTPELQQALQAADSRTALEDLYQPYRQKRRTRASVAREQGLQPIAETILAQARTGALPEALAQGYLSAHRPTAADALAGARDIVAELISDHPEVRRRTREKALAWGAVGSSLVANAVDEKGVYRTYYAFELRVDRVRPHQILALNRGEREKILRVQVAVPERDWRSAVTAVIQPDRRSPWAEQLELAIADGAARLLLPAVERDVRRTLTEAAERHAIAVFARNLRALLSQPPLADHVVLAVDPGYRTGCKVALVDPTGKVLETATIYPHPPQQQWAQAKRQLLELIGRHRVSLIAIGNGTASRESEQLVAELIAETAGSHPLHYLLVNEAGASIYSASPLARGELPELDVTLRGAVSIARRVQDPLAELVKIDPRSIGIGLYQHDVDQAELARTLDGVVESVVNQVGVELNSASAALLGHVSGIGPTLAKRIVAHRDAQGPFTDRRSLLQVTGLGPKAFEQAAGFLRIRSGANPLDATAIHPESYALAARLLERVGLSVHAAPESWAPALAALSEEGRLVALAAELDAGLPTLADIVAQLQRPGRDPRTDLPAPILRRDLLSLGDLQPGLRLPGTVRNVVDFGTFVDIGVKQDGLLHRSQIPAGTLLSVGDVIEVEVQSVEAERGRIGLGWVE